MQTGTVLSQSDVRKIIAEYFGVNESKVISSKYSFTVITDSDDKPLPEKK